MGILISDLVKEQDHKTNYWHFFVLIVSFVLFFLFFNFFIFSLLPSKFDKYLKVFNYSIYGLVGLMIVFKAIKLFKQKEQVKIGEIIIKNEYVSTIINGEEIKKYLLDQKIRFYYDNDQRGRSFDGYSELQVNDEKFHFKVSENSDIEELISIFKFWYHSKFNFLEATRGVEEHRLILLTTDFDWKKLQEIKKNIK